MKRAASINTGADHVPKNAKYSIQTIASAGTPLTSFQWQPTVPKKEPAGSSMSFLPPNTTIMATSNSTRQQLVQQNITSSYATQVRRPTIFIKRETRERTIRSITIDLIEKNPLNHLGVPLSRLPLLKNTICSTGNVSLVDCYLTLKKLRQNEHFSLLAEYFEMTEGEAQHTFAKNVVKLARYMRFLMNWPDSKKHYDRHKNLPFIYRQNLSSVQSLMECVETDMAPCPLKIDCSSYKYLLSINTNGIISYISDAFIGHHDDVTVFQVSNFKNVMPKYLSLAADPGKGVRRRRKPKTKNQQSPASNNNEEIDQDSSTDSADESSDGGCVENDEASQEAKFSKYIATRVAGDLASNQSLSVVNHELTSRRVKNFTIPTMKVREVECRQQMRQMVNSLQEFRILQSMAIKEVLIYQYLNEVLVVCAALTNLQR